MGVQPLGVDAHRQAGPRVGAALLGGEAEPGDAVVDALDQLGGKLRAREAHEEAADRARQRVLDTSALPPKEIRVERRVDPPRGRILREQGRQVDDEAHASGRGARQSAPGTRRSLAPRSRRLSGPSRAGRRARRHPPGSTPCCWSAPPWSRRGEGTRARPCSNREGNRRSENSPGA